MASLSQGPRALHIVRPQFYRHITPIPQHRLLSTTKTLNASQPPTANKQLQKSTPEPTTLQTYDVNAPLTTLPAALTPPPFLAKTAPLPDKLKRLFEIGRTYLTFYKTGLKNVISNYRAASPHRATLNLPKYLPVSHPRTSQKNADISLTRSHYQLVLRSARDTRRLIPFTLVLLVCGEFTPLIVPLFGSALTPATCRLPGQVAKDRAAASRRKTAALSADALAKAQSQKAMPAAVPAAGSGAERALLLRFADKEWVRSASATEVVRACAVFGLVRSHESLLGGILGGSVYRRRLGRYVEYLRIDDGLIRRGGGVKKLSVAELEIALDERGAGDVAAVFKEKKGEEGVEREREWLQGWLDARKKD